MKEFDQKTSEKIRKKHNEELLKKLQKGESLKSFDSTSSWFPPRPVIEKDKKALEMIHKDRANKENDEVNTRHLTALPHNIPSEYQGSDNTPQINDPSDDEPQR